ncbi:hypothetical protein HDIA_1989 [Hartmannibacter diazotrophicus]|uniref:Uncharacterized protein n=1 Tax=Hartmannibacter diazotrophicus TaxID=1482074 RepID=A0A2C9D5R5_9HYPH|nr:hypothetical protein [Hartmannibacter diazotrophicus]SON55530.1 hypothetical protein HDIA_1989 [Hartmannibacter diazotrophicus]
MTTESYRVRDGYAYVNGAPVPASRIVDLTEAEARFDLDRGRIDKVPAKARRRKAAAEAGEAQAGEAEG